MSDHSLEKNALTIYIAGTSYRADDGRYVLKNMADGTNSAVMKFDGPGADNVNHETHTGGTKALGNTRAELKAMLKKISQKINEANSKGLSFTDINIVGFSRGAVNAVALADLMQDDETFAQAVNLFLVDPSSGHGRKGADYFRKAPACVKDAVVIYPEDAGRVYGRVDKTRLAFHKKTSLYTLEVPGDHSDCLRVKQEEKAYVDADSCQQIALVGHALMYDFLLKHGTTFNALAKTMPVVCSKKNKLGSGYELVAGFNNGCIGSPQKLSNIYNACLKRGQIYVNAHHRYLVENSGKKTKDFLESAKTIEESIKQNPKPFVEEVCKEYLTVSVVAFNQRSKIKALLASINKANSVEDVRQLVLGSMENLRKQSRIYNALDLLLKGDRPALHQLKRQSRLLSDVIRLYYYTGWQFDSWFARAEKKLPHKPVQQAARMKNVEMFKALEHIHSQNEELVRFREAEIIDQAQLVHDALNAGALLASKVYFDKLNELTYKAANIKSFKAFVAVKKAHAALVKHTGGVAIQFATLGKSAPAMAFKRRSTSRWSIYRYVAKKRFSVRKDGLGLMASNKGSAFEMNDKRFALTQFVVAMVFEQDYLLEPFKPFCLAKDSEFTFAGLSSGLAKWIDPIIRHALSLYYQKTGCDKTVTVELISGKHETFSASHSLSPLSTNDTKIVNRILSRWLDAKAFDKFNAINQAEKAAATVVVEAPQQDTLRVSAAQ